jgi:hypothetical protein
MAYSQIIGQNVQLSRHRNSAAASSPPLSNAEIARLTLAPRSPMHQHLRFGTSGHILNHIGQQIQFAFFELTKIAPITREHALFDGLNFELYKLNTLNYLKQKLIISYHQQNI